MEKKLLLLAALAGFIMTGVVIAENYNDDAMYYGEDDFLQNIVSAPFAIAEGAAKLVVDTAGGVGTFFERDILSGPDRFIRRSFLDPSGLTVGYDATVFYQQNANGGSSTHRKAGRFSGDYNIEVAGDLNKFFDLPGGIYMNAGGTWSKTGDIDTPSVGSIFGVGGAGARRSLDVVELWYQQAFFDETLRIRVGKLDLGGGFECRGCPVSFDGNTYANSSASQFQNGALGNNPQIPFPEQGLGIMAYYNPVDFWYAGFGVSDAQADARETGFATAFHDEDYYVYMFETGVTPRLDSANGQMQGAYRVGLWVDGQDKSRFSNGKNYRDDIGVYSSCDQMVYKENSDEEDAQGIGVFGRWGYANSDLNEIAQFISGGVQYQGILEGRDDDVLAFGMAHGALSNKDGANDGAGYTEDNETVYEVYYNAAVSDNLSITPSLQYVKNTGGDNTISDAVVLGVRAYFVF